MQLSLILLKLLTEDRELVFQAVLASLVSSDAQISTGIRNGRRTDAQLLSFGKNLHVGMKNWIKNVAVLCPDDARHWNSTDGTIQDHSSINNDLRIQDHIRRINFRHN